MYVYCTSRITLFHGVPWGLYRKNFKILFLSWSTLRAILITWKISPYPEVLWGPVPEVFGMQVSPWHELPSPPPVLSPLQIAFFQIIHKRHFKTSNLKEKYASDPCLSLLIYNKISKFDTSAISPSTLHMREDYSVHIFFRMWSFKKNHMITW
jgi:hypothetical protein